MTPAYSRNPAFNKIAISCMVIILMAGASLSAQESLKEPAARPGRRSLEDHPDFRKRAIVIHIVSSIVEENQKVVWNENAKVTIPGRPVGMRLVGDNLVVAAQFTPILRANERPILVAQGQIWIKIPDEGMRYHSAWQTIPFEWGEQIYFFPLGSENTENEASIEIQLVLERYAEGSAAESSGGGNTAPNENRE